MNTPNNKRRRESRARIEEVFFDLIQEHELSRVSVSEICKRAGVNRSTFYANYADVYELAESVRNQLEEAMAKLYRELGEGDESYDYLRLFRHIKENQGLYRTYFKLGFDQEVIVTRYSEAWANTFYDGRFVEYHAQFFRAGITALIKMWLARDCAESPEELYEILTSEYAGRSKVVRAEDSNTK